MSFYCLLHLPKHHFIFYPCLHVYFSLLSLPIHVYFFVPVCTPLLIFTLVYLPSYFSTPLYTCPPTHMSHTPLPISTFYFFLPFSLTFRFLSFHLLHYRFPYFSTSFRHVLFNLPSSSLLLFLPSFTPLPHLFCFSSPFSSCQASPEYVAGLNSTTIWGDGLLETHAGLALTLKPSHFDSSGQLRFRCAASIPGLYHKVRQHTIGAPPPLPPSPHPPVPPSPSSYDVRAPVMESRDSAAASSAASSAAAPSAISEFVLFGLSV